MPTRDDSPEEGPSEGDRRGGYRRVDDVDFGELIAGLGGSIAEAQLSLERGFVQSTREFADERVDVVSRIVPRVVPGDHGTERIEYESETESRSLLELGVTPPRYQFSEATVDVEFDLSFAREEAGTERNRSRSGRRGRTSLRADTHEVTHRRRYQEAATATARVSARLVPVPLPVTLGDPPVVEPIERGDDEDGPDDEDEPADEGEADADDGDTTTDEPGPGTDGTDEETDTGGSSVDDSGDGPDRGETTGTDEA